jgi:hypothetical protein
MSWVNAMPSIDKFVKDNLGDKALEKLNYQTTGGNNNAKGNRHEQFFAVYKLAELSVSFSGDDIDISSQDKAFVDDLTILNKTKQTKISFQLKDSKTVYWHKSKGISTYFIDQYKLDTLFHKIADAKTILVLAQENVYGLRSVDIPKSIEQHTECLLFKNPETVNRMLLENIDFRKAVGAMCAYPDEIDKIEVVTQLILGSWVTHKENKKSVAEFINLAKKGANPDFFKDDSNKHSLDTRVSKILDKIDEITYTIGNGYLNYNFGSFSGQVRAKLGTSSFDKICSDIIKQNPTDPMELCKVLMQTGT